ncbi:MAG: glycosyltransferase [Pseudomonadota bacterium]|nr:MAG: glycosyltransferase [Pseudomonadota bacterium]
MKTIAYLHNVYARAGDTFIRAEVRQLRGFGHTVLTFSVREPDPSELISVEICDEHARTDYILSHGFLCLLISAIRELLRAPRRTCAAIRVAARCGWPGIKGRLWPFAYFFEACYLSRQLREKRVDHLHDHNGEGCAFVAMLASMLSGVPYSLTIHGPGEFDRPTLLSLAEKVRRSQFTVAISDYGRSQILRWIAPEDWTKVHVVRCGVRFDNGNEAVGMASDRRLVCVGRLSMVKGHLTLLEAIARLKAEAAFEVVIVGDGPLRRTIEERTVALGIQDRVTLTGWMSAEGVHQEIARSCAMVLPSFAEGLPVVLMEAFAVGRPVIATAITGIPELVEPGLSGWLVPAGSIDALSAAIREVLSTAPERLASMGRAGNARVRERHDQCTEARKLEALIDRHSTMLHD